ncbi:peptide/nickel transport system substrate-binding protein [Sinobacterium caligoides]|uniref:Peptide/nickel transport system substrate-binding protein n=1 Tax=Sinobacterium caligoides TaxID=933926 RepID=A0A3N2DZP1_9GAMM|nr:ABC transporter substrate-binding protein [Sinobacterium caligoides]ROS05112.1 peptide/nickel transport system substrate-binding protein [Sinobacterium caligoides]
MKSSKFKAILIALSSLFLFSFVATSVTASTPKQGGILNFVVGSKIPSYDGHIESTFGMIHPIRPFYSLLIRANPDNPNDPTDFVCDVCEGEVPRGEKGGTEYTFKLRKGIAFHNGARLTALDVKATFDKIIFPPEGVKSNRKAMFKMVDSIVAKDDVTVVFSLKYPSGAFIPALAMPFNFIYSKADLDAHGYEWHKKNINGTGAFVFVEHVPGSHVAGERYSNYHHEGKPFLDGFKAISAPKMSVRLNAIRADRAAIDFRGFPPKARDDLVNALGDKITVQESDWNCALTFTTNNRNKPFDDPRVRQALTLAVDRYEASKYLSNIAIVKTVGGIVFPGHPLAARPEELENLIGFSHDIKANRAKARALLKEAGADKLEFDFNNRGVDQPYKVVGTWLVDQWRRIGLKPVHRVQPSPQFFATLTEKHDFDVSIDSNCQSIVNPIADVSKFLCSAENNYAGCESSTLDETYDRLLKASTLDEQRAVMREFEKEVFDNASTNMTLWWYKINPYRSYVKGWKTSSSHYVNQSLDQVWLDQ